MGECKLTRRGKGETPEPPTGKTYLYNEGDEFITLTGGWINDTIYPDTVTMSKNTDNITMNIPTIYAGGCITSNPISMSGYNTIKCIVSGGSGDNYAANVILTINKNCEWQDSSSPDVYARIVCYQGSSAFGETEFSLDVSGLNVSGYPQIGAYARSFTVKKVWLE